LDLRSLIKNLVTGVLRLPPMTPDAGIVGVGRQQREDRRTGGLAI
jgi:hypothetical protein